MQPLSFSNTGGYFVWWVTLDNQPGLRMIRFRRDTDKQFSASDIGATQFIDLILTEWYTQEERDRFLSGLADVDGQAQALFVEKFVDPVRTFIALLVVVLFWMKTFE